MQLRPSKEELSAYEARWLRPAGLAALAAAVVSVVGVGVQHAGLHFPSGDSDADQLAFLHTHSSRLVLGAVIQAVGTALLAIPLVFLFKAASGRAARVRGRFVIPVAVGPVLLAIAMIVISVAAKHVSSEFADQAPAVQEQARAQAQHRTGAQADSKTPEQAANDAREDLADDVGRGYALATVAGVLQLLGALMVLFAFVYTPLWAVRTGLLTRPVGYLGIFSGFLLVIPLLGPLSGVAVVIWSAIIGLLFLGAWIRPLPPAWAAGEAVPWPRPGDDSGGAATEAPPGGTVEGSGREVSKETAPGSEAGDGESAPPHPGETQGQRRKKRKRRG